MKLIDTDKIKEAIDKEKQKGNKVALLHGCFDGLHEGHFTLFSEAKKIANIVVVEIEPDKYIQRYKGIHNLNIPCETDSKITNNTINNIYAF